jgi:hypothetical protein
VLWIENTSIFDQEDGGMSSLIVRAAEVSRFIFVSILRKGGSVLVALARVIVSIIIDLASVLFNGEAGLRPR